MKFDEDKIDEGYFISAYGPGEVVVSGRTLTESFVISAESLIEAWPPEHIDELHHDHLQHILQLDPELVLIGTGETLKFPPVRHYASLIEANIGVEIMDSGAACRTYNILIAEGRQVVAGIIV
jgi:uncharacterized protein